MLAHAPAKCHNVVHKTDSRSREIVFFVFFLSLATFRPADTAAGDNAKEHNLMCRLIQLGERQLSIPELDTSASSVQATMNEINVSTSEPEWTSLFKVETEDSSSQQFPATGPAIRHKEDWQPRWDAWSKAALAAHARTKDQGSGNPYPRLTDDAQRRALHVVVEQYAQAAAELAKKQSELKATAQTTAKQEAENELKAAVFGTASRRADVAANKILADASSRANACAGDKAGYSILGDFYCLCNGRSASANNCGSGYSGTNGAGSLTFGPGETTALLNTCTKATDAPTTAADIDALLSEFATALRRDQTADNGKVVLGTTTAHNCNGAANEICVAYTSHFTKQTKKGIEEIPWVIRLRSAQKAMLRMATAAAVHDTLAHQIKTLKTKMDVAYKAAVQGRLATAETGSQRVKPEQATDKGKHNHHEKCKNPPNKTAEGCANIDCDYDAEKNECKPKTETVTKAAGTGEKSTG
uniref:Variant surface glycoprotein 1125.2526 n=1 Tax=Trypanosoma brucei TaxID=5691 RepID=A0A1J0R8A6_9TRYP|nr:variant surface glycoprotein 1125.2526 [Trypanosoma brucei]